VLPLQAQTFRYTKPCASGQKRQSAFRFSEVTHDCIRLFGSENHRFVSAGCLAADKTHWIRFLVSRNQTVPLAMLIYQGHYATGLVERRVGKSSFFFQGPQPLLYFQRFYAKCDSV